MTDFTKDECTVMYLVFDRQIKTMGATFFGTEGIGAVTESLLKKAYVAASQPEEEGDVDGQETLDV